MSKHPRRCRDWYIREGSSGLLDRSSRPGTSPHSTPAVNKLKWSSYAGTAVGVRRGSDGKSSWLVRLGPATSMVLLSLDGSASSIKQAGSSTVTLPARRILVARQQAHHLIRMVSPKTAPAHIAQLKQTLTEQMTLIVSTGQHGGLNHGLALYR